MIINMPQVGMTMVEGTIEMWKAADGEHVEKGDALMEFSTEKLTNEMTAPTSGTLKIIAQEGEIVPCGEPIAEIQ